MTTRAMYEGASVTDPQTEGLLDEVLRRIHNAANTVESTANVSKAIINNTWEDTARLQRGNEDAATASEGKIAAMATRLRDALSRLEQLAEDACGNVQEIAKRI